MGCVISYEAADPRQLPTPRPTRIPEPRRLLDHQQAAAGSTTVCVGEEKPTATVKMSNKNQRRMAEEVIQTGQQQQQQLPILRSATPPSLPDPPTRPLQPVGRTMIERCTAMERYIENLQKLKYGYKKTIESTIQRILEFYERASNQDKESVRIHGKAWMDDTERLVGEAMRELTQSLAFLEAYGSRPAEQVPLQTLDEKTEDSFNDKFPSHLRCPITLNLMVDPVVAADGNTYERKALENWFVTCTGGGRRITSPLTGVELSSKQYLPLPALKVQCQKYSNQLNVGSLFPRTVSSMVESTTTSAMKSETWTTPGVAGETGTGTAIVQNHPLLFPASPTRPTQPSGSTVLERSLELQSYIEKMVSVQDEYKQRMARSIDRITEAYERACNRDIESARTRGFAWIDNTEFSIQSAKKMLQHAELFLERQGVSNLTLDAWGDNDQKEDALSHLKCPIKLRLMKDPVVAWDGNTYDREALEGWFADCVGRGRLRTSPLTGVEFTAAPPYYLPVNTLKMQCQEWHAKTCEA